jgi:hypothetical protein
MHVGSLSLSLYAQSLAFPISKFQLWSYTPISRTKNRPSQLDPSSLQINPKEVESLQILFTEFII